ncbi:MAG: response regulator [Rickettsiales bacterium]|nr:response regulator [Rickettsiales bacterium]
MLSFYWVKENEENNYRDAFVEKAQSLSNGFQFNMVAYENTLKFIKAVFLSSEEIGPEEYDLLSLSILLNRPDIRGMHLVTSRNDDTEFILHYSSSFNYFNSIVNENLVDVGTFAEAFEQSAEQNKGVALSLDGSWMEIDDVFIVYPLFQRSQKDNNDIFRNLAKFYNADMIYASLSFKIDSFFEDAFSKYEEYNKLKVSVSLNDPNNVIYSNGYSEVDPKFTHNVTIDLFSQKWIMNYTPVQEYFDKRFKNEFVVLIGGFLLSIAVAAYIALLFYQRQKDKALQIMLGEAHEEAVTAKDKAEKANRVKSDFLAIMSHEIRTPMNAILGMTNLILDTSLDNDQKKWAHAIKTSGDTLLSIINDIIDISKIEAGKLVLEEIEFNFRQVVDESVSLYSHMAQEKRIELVVEIDPEIPHLLKGDPVRIKQILTNLTSNALKFMYKGHVSIRVSKTYKDVGENRIDLLFDVEDTGIGIPKDKQKKIFEKFSQAEESTIRKFGGTGLGLTIVSELVEKMNGSIGIKNEEGKGSCFSFNVVLGTDTQTQQNEYLNDLSHLNILIIEDYQLTCQVLEMAFDHRKISYHTVASAEEALTLLDDDSLNFSCCLIDQVLVDMNGLDFIEKIRAIPRFNAMGIIMMTGQIDHISYEKLHEMGLDGYFNKPFQQNKIVDAVEFVSRCRSLKPKVSYFVTHHNIEQLRKQTDLELEGRQHHASSSSKKTYKQYPGIKVLAVDDIELNMMLITKVLSKFGLDVDRASNGIEALKKVKEGNYDAVFMDCQMPEMDGFEATEKIRFFEKDTGRKKVPIIALTADAMVGDRDKCISFGMDDYINKPFKEGDIAAALEKWVGTEDSDLE